MDQLKSSFARPKIHIHTHSPCFFIASDGTGWLTFIMHVYIVDFPFLSLYDEFNTKNMPITSKFEPRSLT